MSWNPEFHNILAIGGLDKRVGIWNVDIKKGTLDETHNFNHMMNVYDIKWFKT